MNKNNIISLDRARAARQGPGNGGQVWPRAVARRIGTDEIRQHPLHRTLALWQSKAGRGGVFRIGRDGALGDLHELGFLGPRSLMVSVTSDGPESWIVTYVGDFMAETFRQPSCLGYRFVDLPLSSITPATTAAIAAALPDQQVAVHHVDGHVHERLVSYERLILPIANARDRINRFITTSAEFAKVRSRTLNYA